ncbi:hypothetical protein CI109_107220 [Kwoniella shandongensis]|uniref:DUF4097 domain-containing protein n=1 Tax=Kwoniella shandongensis TaxID=1734106 RepID=A0A5M6C5W2_9TREE|nr:uncharacterized protein CI109_002503 [Kwoniella shandongensis]KAA5529162.1 hypothetical protein CI109_002503 [Kwoniella shandongensis]
MPALPVYHSVPTDEKRAIADSELGFDSVTTTPFDSRKYHPASIGILQRSDEQEDGRTYITRAKDGYRGLSKVKKALVALAVVWFTLAAAHKTANFVTSAGHRHHHDRHEDKWIEYSMNGVVYDRQRPSHLPDETPDCHDFAHKFDYVPATYDQAFSINGDLSVANASWPVLLNRGRNFELNFDGIAGNVVISRSGDQFTEDDRHAPVIVTLESTWSGEGVEGVKMMTNEETSMLSLSPASEENDVSHTVHIVLPAQKRRISSLSISSTKSLKLDIHSSAEDVVFKHLSVKSESGDISLPAIIAGRLELETSAGGINGTYNVSRALVLRTITGDINAEINVVPLFPPGPHGPNHTHPHHPPHHKQDEEFDLDESHVDRPHDHHDHHEHRDDHDHHERRHDKHHKHEKKHKKHHKKHEHKPSSWLPLSWFRPHHPPPDHRPPPRPVFIGAFSTTGTINLNVTRQPPFVSSDIKAFSHTGHVTVQAAKTFHGLYEIGTFQGKYEVSVPESFKHHKVLEEVKGEIGGRQKGLVFGPPPHRNVTEVEGELQEEDLAQRDDEDHRPDHPPSKGPHGPPGHGHDGPPDHPPHGPPHHPPHGPPHHPPHGPPHHPPHGPPPHHPPPPPGSSRVSAHTDVGDVKVIL